MKIKELTPAYPYKGILLQGRIEQEWRAGCRPRRIRWDIGTFDNYAETSNAIRDHHRSAVITQMAVEALGIARREHRIFHIGFAGIGSRWGHITVHKDQVEPFLTEFKLLWLAILHNVGMQFSQGVK